MPMPCWTETTHSELWAMVFSNCGPWGFVSLLQGSDSAGEVIFTPWGKGQRRDAPYNMQVSWPVWTGMFSPSPGLFLLGKNGN